MLKVEKNKQIFYPNIPFLKTPKQDSVLQDKSRKNDFDNWCQVPLTAHMKEMLNHATQEQPLLISLDSVDQLVS